MCREGKFPSTLTTLIKVPLSSRHSYIPHQIHVRFLRKILAAKLKKNVPSFS